MDLRYALLSLSLIACVPADTAPKAMMTQQTQTIQAVPLQTILAVADCRCGFLEPVAIGFEYTGVWNQTEDTLNPYLYPDLDGSNGGEAYDAVGQGDLGYR